MPSSVRSASNLSLQYNYNCKRQVLRIKNWTPVKFFLTSPCRWYKKCAEISKTFPFLSEVTVHAAKVPFLVPWSILPSRGQPAFSFTHWRDLRPIIWPFDFQPKDFLLYPAASDVSLLFQLDLAHEEYWQPFLLAHGCDDSILASATLLCNHEVCRDQIFPFVRSLTSWSLTSTLRLLRP